MAKADKSKPEAAAAPASTPEPAEQAPKRAPADPRMKFIKKFDGRFLPKGILRERLKALMVRWDSGDDHGGVTVEELKTLHGDWKASREKKRKKPAGA